MARRVVRAHVLQRDAVPRVGEVQVDDAVPPVQRGLSGRDGRPGGLRPADRVRPAEQADQWDRGEDGDQQPAAEQPAAGWGNLGPLRGVVVRMSRLAGFVAVEQA